jgi:hypothetical protein
VKSFFGILTIVSLLVHAAFGQEPYKFRPVNHIAVEEAGSTLDLAWAGGMNSAQFGTIDLNGDDLADLCIFDRTTNKISTFINTGTDYQYAPQYEYYFPKNLNGWLVLADYDCDGRKDLFTNTTFGLKVYRNVSGDHLSFELQEDPLMTESAGQMVNLQVSSSDIPAVVDVDGDGDLDILTFRFVTGGSIEYHQNQSMENNGDCSQLHYKMVTTNWGNFEECDCGEYVFGKTCSDPGGRRQHAGGKSLLTLDLDHDGALEIIFGDEYCTNIAFMYNYGDSDNAMFTEAQLNFPNSLNPIDFFIFPGLFLEDVTFDGRKDLLASPGVFENFGLGVDFLHSSYLYLNDGVTGLEAFNILETNQFLQERMVELGENAAPVFMDIDGDNDEDMIIGHRGNRIGPEFYATFHLFENTGSDQDAEFTDVTDDYLNLSSSRLNALKPSYGDLDGDGRQDLLFAAADGTGQTRIYYFINKANMGFEPAGSTPEILAFDIQAGDHPHFVDVSSDGKADLLLGRRAGRLEYWRNTSSGGNFTFELINAALAGITDDSFRRELVPLAADMNRDGELELITTDATGVMRIYTDYLDASEAMPPQSFEQLIEPNSGQTSVGSRWGIGATLTNANLGPGLPYLVIGSRQGGLFLLENLSEPGTSSGGDEFTMDLFPNPGIEQVTFQANQNFTIRIYNSLGQLVYRDADTSTQNQLRFDSRTLNPGVYLVSGISESGARDVKKLIVAR